MNQFKNLHYLEDLPEADKEKIEHAAAQHKQFNNLQFKAVKYGPDSITIQVSQGRNGAGAYHNTKRLVEIVHETFDRFFTGNKIIVNPIPYKESPATAVDAAWIQKKMLDTGTKLKQISDDTGIDYTQLSSLTSGDRPLSQSMKAMFYYYFLSKKGGK